MSKRLKTNPAVVPLRRVPQAPGTRTEIQDFGTIKDVPIGLSASVREEMVQTLNEILGDTITLRDLYKKAHWHVSGPTFYQLHLLFDKHHSEQAELVDKLAERVQTLGGISLAMAHEVAETSKIPRVPPGREDVPAMISRILGAHQVVLKQVRESAVRAEKSGDLGTNDLLVSDVLRTNEMQVWFLSEHLAQTLIGTVENQ